MNASDRQTQTPAANEPAQKPVPTTVVPPVPGTDPATTSPHAAKGDDDLMSQRQKSS